jgi:type VI secretion system secreted protein Hcp
MFMKIVAGGSAVAGESNDNTHAGEIEIQSWSWGVVNSGSSHTSTGQGAGRAQVGDLTFTAAVDKSIPNLWQMCCGGTAFDTATLTIRKAGGTEALEYIKIIMTNGLVSSVQFAGSPHDDVQHVTVSLNFGKVELDYTPQVHAGSGDAVITKTYDITKNVIS